ncbi:MAG: hypothetical protein K8I30_20490 [Anaerolineae bacterium]|nr:hypothetical protein [Anaerolineae bacterium]
MKLQDLLRYSLWGGVVATSAAKFLEYRVVTAWLPHLAINSVALLLPDAARVILPPRPLTSLTLEHLARAMVRDNDDYVTYPAPLAIGFILSHPRFNIYKRPWSDLQLMGFRLDAIPHGATGLAVTLVVIDTLRTGAKLPDSLLTRLLRLGNRNRGLVSLAGLIALTAIWEYGEYRVHTIELEKFGDPEKVNMQWSPNDTARDVAANLTGWALALVLSQESEH